MLEQKQIIPPYKPHIRSERDLEHFDPAFTNEPVRLTPDDPWVFFYSNNEFLYFFKSFKDAELFNFVYSTQ